MNYEHFGTRLDYKGMTYAKADVLVLEKAEADALIANDVPIRPAEAGEPAAPAEVKEHAV